ncbi:MAG: hypothetical protein HYX71_11855 [Opitutae bacterium]|nr:hypothetical protein [Opitutae bacterium]
MLKSIFEWLDHHPGSYWVFAGAATLLLVARLVILIRPAACGSAASQRADWRDAAVLFLFLLAWRWPYLFVAHELNPDESQLIAGALTLAHDPVFWRSVDGGSSGPFNYYFLLPWAWLGLPLDYFTARLTGLLLVWGALFLSLRSLTDTCGRAVAWLALLPAAAFFATATHRELTHHSTEHLPLLLIAGIFALLAGRTATEQGRLRFACLLAGTLPWTKLQTTPIALAFLGWAFWQVWRESESTRGRGLAGAVCAALLPTLLLTGMTAATGQMEAAVRRYFLQNFAYVGEGAPFREALGALWRNAEIDGRFPLFLGTVVAGLVAATTCFAKHRVRPPSLLIAAGGVSLAAVAAVIAPRREFLHYVLLLPVPLTFWLGAALGGWWSHVAVRSRLVLAGTLLAAGLLPLGTRSFQAVPDVYGRFAHDWRHPHSGAALVLRALAGRNDTLGLWGWAGHLHVESGLRQATRDGNTLCSIVPNAQQAYHRAVYLADLKRSAPAVFVDAVGQGAFTFDYRAVQSHENFAELARYIREHYTLVVDLLDARIYARRDLISLAGLDQRRLWQLVRRGRQAETLNLSPPGSSLDKLQTRMIGQRRVVMLLPPVSLDWPLGEEVVEVTLEFGYDPVAYEQGRSNGTELYLELADPSGTREVYHRFLDPARVPADRGPQSARVVLPPFAPGATLVLRTDPGPYGDNAWDWVYLAGLRLHGTSAPGAK